ncbi:nucleoside hydrolase [Streptomyces sp. NPDC002659]|uniref:nucleoside hydrolase n=1 Tax=Streptomyces sp. NPDC002659 TaxID=3364656 RepID=UPI003696D6BD
MTTTGSSTGTEEHQAQDVILDVDTGCDDALAVLYALRSPRLNLRAITCVNGNVDVDTVVCNTLRVLDAAGAPHLPVARGAARPLVEPPHDARHVHGTDGLGDLPIPGSTRTADPRHAVELMRDIVATSPRPVTLILLAPQTNAALFARMYPEVFARLGRIVMMAGSGCGGNATPTAEFNVHADPEAAHIVLNTRVPTLMYGLDVYYQTQVDPGTVEALRTSHLPTAQLAGLLLHERYRRAGRASLGDAGAVAAASDPRGLTTTPFPVGVELSGTWCRGTTVVDRRGPGRRDAASSTSPSTVEVAHGIDGPHYTALFRDTLLGQPVHAAAPSKRPRSEPVHGGSAR